MFLKNGGRIRHYEAMEKDDLNKLWTYFDRSNGTKLLHEVYFILLYYFGQRGREWLRLLNVNSLVFELRSGVETVRLNGGLEKTVGTRLSPGAMEDNREAIVKSTGGEHCPVAAIKLYLEKREASLSAGTAESNMPLFLMPSIGKKAVHWYTAKPMGVNALQNLMARISATAQLSKVYSGHNVRPTVISELHDAGFRLEQICKITSHKDVKTVQRYLTNGKRKASDLGKMSDVLSASLYGASSSTATNDKSEAIVEPSGDMDSAGDATSISEVPKRVASVGMTT